MPGKPKKPQDRLIVGLSGSTLKEVEKWVQLLIGDVNIFEVNMPFYTTFGPDVIKVIHDHGGKVFLDLKYHDIPSTVAKAVEEATKLGAEMMDVHAAGGGDMLQRSVDAALHVAGSKSKMPKIFAVTVLTSMDSLADIGIQYEVRDQVVRLAKLSQQCGLHGVIASPLEIKPIRNACGDKFIIVTTGVRPLGTLPNDQRRIASPTMTIAAGADYIVVGRPVQQAKDPKVVVKDILKEIEE